MALTRVTYDMTNGALINVLDYGADKTGAADSTAAIQAALTFAGTLSIADPSFSGAGYSVKGGATVFLPAGEYKTSSSLTVPQNVSMLGAGKQSTIIRSTATNYIIKIDDAAPTAGTYDKNGITFRDFGLIGDRSLTNQIGFGLLRWTFGAMENVSVIKCGSHGIAMYQCLGSTLLNVEAIYNIGHGLVIQQGFTSWAVPTPNSLPSNANQIVNYHGMQNDGAGVYIGTGANGNLFYSAVCEYNYLAAGDNAGYNVFSETDSFVPNTFYGLWTEGPAQAHVYINNTTADVILKIEQWRHFANGAAGNVDRALLVNVGTAQLFNAFGQATLYKTLNASNAPFRVNKASGIVCLTDTQGSLVTGVKFVDDTTGATTGLENNLFQYTFGTMYNTQRVYQTPTVAYHQAWYNDTQTEPFAAISGNKNGLLLGDGSAAPEVVVRTGAGSPQGAVVAPVGSLYLRTDGGGGTTLYVKESGVGNTGWVAK